MLTRLCGIGGAGAFSKKACNLAPTWGCQHAPCNCRGGGAEGGQGGLLLSSANGSRRCAKARPLPRNNAGAAIKAEAEQSELRITQETA